MKIRLLLPLLVLASCAARPGQRVRVVDSLDRPVAGAHVRLAGQDEAKQPVERFAITDDQGVAVFEDLPRGSYNRRDAGANPLWHVEWFELGWFARLPGDEIEIELQELFIGGVEAAPDLELINMSWNGRDGYWSGHSAIWQGREGELLPSIEPWASRHPEATFISGFRNPNGCAESTTIQLEWRGYAPHKEQVAMWPLSTYRGPRKLDVSELVPIPWTEVAIELRATNGERVQPTDAINARLRKLDDNEFHRWYSIRGDGKLDLPCGRYDLYSELHWDPVGPFVIDETTGTLVCQLPPPPPR